jgi:Siphovirus Gp157
MSTLTVVPNSTPPNSTPPNSTLRALEARLTELEDTAALVPAEQEKEFFAELGAAMVAAVEKRDAVHNFMRRLEAQQASDALEIKRLTARQDYTAKLLERLEAYVVSVIRQLGQTEDGKWRKLAGKFVTFSIRNSPPAVTIADEQAVPAEFKSVTVTLPLTEWDALLDSLDLENHARLVGAIKKPAIACSKTAIKAALAAGPVPGASLSGDKQYLVRQ